jgi:hypothetical protein
LPIDWTAEFESPAKMYQHCLPQVFRYINSVTKTETELLAIINGTRPAVTDMWETTHIETATGTWDHEKELLETTGFTTVITAEEIGEARHLGEFDGNTGYVDEYGLEYFWQYVDNTVNRTPRNRMYLGWMTTTTHVPFEVSPEWLEHNYQAFVQNDGWNPVDRYLNAVRWTDDKVKEIILGFRERGLENETLFLMYYVVPKRILITVTVTMVSHSSVNGKHLWKILIMKPTRSH